MLAFALGAINGQRLRTALVLLAIVLGMNLLATIIRSRARARRQW